MLLYVNKIYFMYFMTCISMHFNDLDEILITLFYYRFLNNKHIQDLK